MFAEIAVWTMLGAVVLWPTLMAAIVSVGRFTGLQIPEMRHFVWQAAVTAIVMAVAHAVAMVLVVKSLPSVLVLPYVIEWMALTFGAVIPVKKCFEGTFGESALLGAIGLFAIAIVSMGISVAA